MLVQESFQSLQGKVLAYLQMCDLAILPMSASRSKFDAIETATALRVWLMAALVPHSLRWWTFDEKIATMEISRPRN